MEQQINAGKLDEIRYSQFLLWHALMPQEFLDSGTISYQALANQINIL